MQDDTNDNMLNEPPSSWGIRIFGSVEDAANEQRAYWASLTPLERMINLRKLINMSYGMHGYDPDHLSPEHHIEIVR
jgi:hypothetical protein